MALKAVIWDFDGTLVDSRHKNLSVTRNILEELGTRNPDDVASLRDIDSYEEAIRRSTNWREMYEREFGLSPEETEEAGRLWESTQIADPTPPLFYDGIVELLAEISPLSQAVVSQNSAQFIDRALDLGGVRHHFGPILGHEHVERDRQKPHPKALLLCLERLGLIHNSKEGDVVLFVGDHEVDTRCAHRAHDWLAGNGHALSVRSVVASYGFAGDTSGWGADPHHHAEQAEDVLHLARSLQND